MLFQLINDKFAVSRLTKILVAPLLLFWFGVSVAFAQVPSDEQSESPRTVTEEAATAPVMRDYRGIKIGMTADEVKDKLGKPRVSDETGYFYALSDTESVQIVFDADKTVRVISAMYSKGEKAPEYKDVFGKDATIASQPDGSIYNRAQYPQAGYVVVYSRSAGDNPMIVITLQELPQAERTETASDNRNN
jgi:hypothetical protein